MPQSETVIKLAKVLQMSADYILMEIDYVDDEFLIDEIVQTSKLCNKRERDIISEHITVLLKNRDEDIKKTLTFQVKNSKIYMYLGMIY